MVKNPFEKVIAHTQAYLDERNPHRVVRRIRGAYIDHRWSPEIDALLRNDKIDSSDKFYILLRTKPLKLEYVAPFILGDPCVQAPLQRKR